MFWKAQTHAILVSNDLVFAIAGLFLRASKNHCSTVREIALQVEVHVPRDLAPRSAPDREPADGLYAGRTTTTTWTSTFRTWDMRRGAGDALRHH